MGHNFGGEPRLVMPAAGAVWFTAFYIGTFILSIVLVVGLLVSDLMPWWAALLTTSGLPITGIIIWVVLPRSFEIYDDRLVIVFSLWRWNIGLDSIESVGEAIAWKTYAYWGTRLTTSPKQGTEIRRKHGNFLTRPNVIVTPEDRSIFIPELNAALARYRRLHGAAPTASS